MATLPTPLRAALGLAATALDEARKLPETLPQAPVTAVSTAMQLSLRVQQRIAELAARGDEVLSQLRGTSSEPPEWATFDETPDPTPAAPHNGSGRGLAAFDRVPEGSAGDPGPEAAETGPEVAETGPEVAETKAVRPATGVRPAGKSTKARPTLVSAAETTIAPVKASPTRAAKAKAEAAKAARTKAGGPKATNPTGPKTAKTSNVTGTKAAKATNATGPKASKTTAAKAAGTKAAGGRRPRTGAVSEPLAKAASRAQPSETPNPATMAAEIVQARHATDGVAPAQPGTE